MILRPDFIKKQSLYNKLSKIDKKLKSLLCKFKSRKILTKNGKQYIIKLQKRCKRVHFNKTQVLAIN